MVRWLYLVVAGVGAVAAADSSSVMSVLIPGKGPLTGSVEGANPTAVTFSADCDGGRPCQELLKGARITQGPKTLHIDNQRDRGSNRKHTAAVDCELDTRAGVARCTITNILVNRRGHTRTRTERTVVVDYTRSMSPATLTAGLEKLSNAPTATPNRGGPNKNSKSSASSLRNANAGLSSVLLTVFALALGSVMFLYTRVAEFR